MACIICNAYISSGPARKVYKIWKAGNLALKETGTLDPIPEEMCDDLEACRQRVVSQYWNDTIQELSSGRA